MAATATRPTLPIRAPSKAGPCAGASRAYTAQGAQPKLTEPAPKTRAHADVPYASCPTGTEVTPSDLGRSTWSRLPRTGRFTHRHSAIGTETLDSDDRTVGFVYYGAPNVTLMSPTTGPALGGSPALMLAGSGLHTYGGMHGGSHYRCRFGLASFTTATVSASLDQAYCVAPAGAPRTALPVALALNGQQFHPTPRPYDRMASTTAAELAEASPTSGPVRGGTLVTISPPAGGGQSLGGGDDCMICTSWTHHP